MNYAKTFKFDTVRSKVPILKGNPSLNLTQLGGVFSNKSYKVSTTAANRQQPREREKEKIVTGHKNIKRLPVFACVCAKIPATSYAINLCGNWIHATAGRLPTAKWVEILSEVKKNEVITSRWYKYSGPKNFTAFFLFIILFKSQFVLNKPA